jgi:hypothetical protein
MPELFFLIWPLLAQAKDTAVFSGEGRERIQDTSSGIPSELGNPICSMGQCRMWFVSDYWVTTVKDAQESK